MADPSSPRDAVPTEMLMPVAGSAGIIGGVALAAAYVTHPPVATPEVVASALWAWVHAGLMVSLLCGTFLLIALLAQYFRAGGGMAGFVGFAMAVTSLVFVFGAGLVWLGISLFRARR